MSEVKLMPCPFCGSDVNDDNSGHDESCYFTAQDNFENSCGGDISVVLDAWNSRPHFDAQRLRSDTAEACLEEWRRSNHGKTVLENLDLRKKLAAAEQRIADALQLLAETSKAILHHQANQPMSHRLEGLLTKARAKVDRYLKSAALNPNPEAESHE